MAQLATLLVNENAAGVSLLASAEGGPTYSTTIFDGVTGVERRTVVWETPRHMWAVTFKGLLSDMEDLIALHTEAMGQGYSFLWTPPGYMEGSFRFAQDDLKIAFNVSAISGDHIATIAFVLIETLSE